MPYKPKVYCNSPGCNQLVDTGYCVKHKPSISVYNSNRNRVNSKTYDSTWRKLRRIKLNNSPLCELCLVKGVIVQAEEVDHILPVKDYPELRLDLDNLQSLCVTCHSKKTREENKIEKWIIVLI